MEIGEFTSTEFGELFNKEQDLRRKFIHYCSLHKKTLEFTYLITAENPVLFILKLQINGNNGEINGC
jgi:hypothetical protein